MVRKVVECRFVSVEDEACTKRLAHRGKHTFPNGEAVFG